jgi:hypothetical protein
MRGADVGEVVRDKVDGVGGRRTNSDQQAVVEDRGPVELCDFELSR